MRRKKVTEIEFYPQIKVLSLQTKSATMCRRSKNNAKTRRSEWMNEWSTSSDGIIRSRLLSRIIRLSTTVFYVWNHILFHMLAFRWVPWDGLIYLIFISCKVCLWIYGARRKVQQSTTWNIEIVKKTEMYAMYWLLHNFLLLSLSVQFLFVHTKSVQTDFEMQNFLLLQIPAIKRRKKQRRGLREDEYCKAINVYTFFIIWHD